MRQWWIAALAVSACATMSGPSGELAWVSPRDVTLEQHAVHMAECEQARREAGRFRAGDLVIALFLGTYSANNAQQQRLDAAWTDCLRRHDIVPVWLNLEQVAQRNALPKGQEEQDFMQALADQVRLKQAGSAINATPPESEASAPATNDPEVQPQQE